MSNKSPKQPQVTRDSVRLFHNKTPCELMDRGVRFYVTNACELANELLWT